MYKLLITITNPKAEGPITVSVFGHVVHFDYISRGRVRKLVGSLESPASISKGGIEKVKELLKEHGTGVEVTYKEDPIIAKAAKNIEKMLAGLGEKMNSRKVRSVSQKVKTRKQSAKIARSIAAMPEAEMAAAVASLPRSIQQRVISQSARSGRTFSARSFRNRSSKTMRRAREKRNAQIMKKRMALLARIAEENENRNRS